MSYSRRVLTSTCYQGNATSTAGLRTEASVLQSPSLLPPLASRLQMETTHDRRRGYVPSLGDVLHDSLSVLLLW